MNNIWELINSGIALFQKVFLLILTTFSFLTPTSTETSIIVKTPNEKVDVIINKLNKSVEGTPTNTENTTQSIGKLNYLKITAPDYTIIKIKSKNKQGVAITDTNVTKTSLDDSVINIRCENKTNNTIKVITGSGVLISSSGLVLTAAHVAAPIYSQNNNKYNCYARINNPASGNYPIKVVFIDKQWVTKYYENFEKNNSTTGENDIAILQIDIKNLNNINPAQISLVFPTLNESVTIKSYPADVYGKSGVFTILPRKSEINSVGGFFNFNGDGNGPYDLLETKPSSLGQSGASGGGIFNSQGYLIGIISNVVSSDILFKKKIRAITIKYIDNEIKINLGKSIFEYIK